jgi:hypothetical protein
MPRKILHLTHLTHPESVKFRYIPSEIEFTSYCQTNQGRKDINLVAGNVPASQYIETNRTLQSHCKAENFMHVKSCLTKLTMLHRE